jgi:glycosyltransferase involved in cell wall biosynthesis
MAPSIQLVMMTYNRLEYTRLSLSRLLADHSEKFHLIIWDNGSSDGTKEYLNTIQDLRIVDIVFSERNEGQAYVTNKIWSEANADLVGKVDNDCLVTPGWTKILAQAHEDLPNLGVVGCWHFFPEDFDYERAKHKIRQYGKHYIFQHPWVDGSALLVKRNVYIEHAPCRENEYLTVFWMRLALSGYINGFYYPLVYQEHMDDPRSEHSRSRYMSFDEAYKDCYGYQAGKLKDMEGYKQLHKEILENLLTGPYEPKYYCGWRAKFRQVLSKTNKLLKKTR